VYKYIPNDFAKEKFGLTKKEYEGGSLTNLFEDVLGKENYHKFMVAQDPFSDKRTKKAAIKILSNPAGSSFQKQSVRSIGVVMKP